MQLARVSGLSAIIKALRNAGGTKIAPAVARGLKKGGLFLQAKSQEIVPVQMSTLKNSAFTRNVGGGGFDADIVVGYTADYSVFVHEDLTKAHGRDFNIEHTEEIAAAVKTKRGTAKGGMFLRGENQQAKFLERPARENRRQILNIVAAEGRGIR